MKKIFLFIIPLLFSLGSVRAQGFLWNVELDTRFDNREYDDSDLARSQTLFTSRFSPVIGYGWSPAHAFYGGADIFLDFGSAKVFNILPEVVLYYQYEGKKFRAYAGAFPRKKMKMYDNPLFYCDSTLFYNRLLEGFLIQYGDSCGHIEIGLDWDGMYSAEQRESFRIFSSGMGTVRFFSGGYEFSLYHLAGKHGVKGVIDNLLASPFVRFDFSRYCPLDELSVQANFYQSVQRDRLHDDRYRCPRGVTLDLLVQYWGFGVRNTLYLGQNQMPYYQTYSHRLYAGDPFFQTTNGVYNGSIPKSVYLVSKFLRGKVIHFFDNLDNLKNMHAAEAEP